MKKLIPNYLQYRLPANENFLQYISEEMNAYLIALCNTLFPDSDNKAYIISGVKETYDGFFFSYSAGVIFYKNEFLIVPEALKIYGDYPAHLNYEIYEPGLILQTETINEEFADGNEHPAYEVRKLVWDKFCDVSGPLAYYKMVRVQKYADVVNVMP